MAAWFRVAGQLQLDSLFEDRVVALWAGGVAGEGVCVLGGEGEAETEDEEAEVVEGLRRGRGSCSLFR